MKIRNKIITLENILCLFVILCPIFDIASFIFRNALKTTISVSTFIRPIIPIIVGGYIFITGSKKEKKALLLTAITYILYACAHLYATKIMLTASSYGTVKHELQYIFNFTFLIIDLIIYLYVFIIRKESINEKESCKTNINQEEKKEKSEISKIGNKIAQINKIEKLKKSITIMVAIYITSIYVAIITKTSSSTYITQTGYKGWIESGNSLSAILLLSMFIMLTQIKTGSIKWKIFNLITIALTGIYLITLIGTRTGLFGFFIAVGCYIILEVIFSKNKKIILIGCITFLIGIIGIGLLGSKTLQRRKQMEESKNTIIDESTGEVGNMTGDMLKLKNQILEGKIQEGFLSEAQNKSVIELYQYAKTHNLAGNDTRTQQLMYNIYLVKNQKNFFTFIFGNGYEANLREMVMENELASMFLNFGLVGFILYIMPFISIIIFSIIEGIKNIKQIDEKYIMYQLGSGLALILSWMSGYVFFATSSMVVIVVTNILLLSETLRVRKQRTESLNRDLEDKPNKSKATISI